MSIEMLFLGVRERVPADAAPLALPGAGRAGSLGAAAATPSARIFCKAFSIKLM
jgi:hypothetical protein